MIPLTLSLSGFLSYRDPVEVDFTAVDLACIAGANGAGKSSLLDAMTWALFGQARKRDDALITTGCDKAYVALVFSYEGDVYRVQRIKPRDKTALLEFQILQNDGRTWKALTERTLRETEERIRRTLRMDYDTFVNAAFFLQGKADEFTQQPPGKRKQILSSILGLDVWESYRQRAADQRRKIEVEQSSLQLHLTDIETELAEEQARRSRLQELQADLDRLSAEREVHELSLDQIRRVAASLAEQRRLVESLKRQVGSAERGLLDIQARLEARRQESASFSQILAQAGEIEAAYSQWQAARAELERWEEVAVRFREHEKRRDGPRDEINAERARLEHELKSWQDRQTQVEAGSREAASLQAQRSKAQEGLEQANKKLEQRTSLDAELQAERQRQADARAENPVLRKSMEELKKRIEQLSQTEGAECPLCGQPLSTHDRQRMVDELQAQGKEMAKQFRANDTLLREFDSHVRELERQIKELSRVEVELREFTQALAQAESRLELLDRQRQEWETDGLPRMVAVEQALKEETFAPEARQRLAQVDAELKAIGYDAAAHDAVRRREVAGRASEERLRTLEQARAALAPLEREIGEIQAQVTTLSEDVARQQAELSTAVETLAAAEANAPDLEMAEYTLSRLREQENRLRMEVGQALQLVSVLDTRKAHKRKLEAHKEDLLRQIASLKQLERAFGKDGVPALLIEQALPDIENKSNEILDRLSNGSMSVRFVTQAAYKDKTREDLKETLDIQISDGGGVRDYELFSGGEAFRVNFAIRLALSEVLAQRAGARLQTLVIDEGFGSQDAQGRQRLIEAINLVRQDFAKILVITHIDELKDVFPNRIEVEKTERGSAVRVI